jgi:hypothetical protein
MQAEFGTAPVAILGCNSSGSESNNAAACDGKDIPWLQDTPEEHVWSQWQVTYRDVWILDENNIPVAIYNLTENDLNDNANYAHLKALIQSYLPP